MALPPFKKIQGIPEVLDTSNEGAQTCPIHSTSGSVGGAIIIRKCCGEGISEGVAPVTLSITTILMTYVILYTYRQKELSTNHFNSPQLNHRHTRYASPWSPSSGTFRIPLATEGLTVHASSEVLGPQEEGVHTKTWGLKRQTWRLSLMWVYN